MYLCNRLYIFIVDQLYTTGREEGVSTQDIYHGSHLQQLLLAAGKLDASLKLLVP